ncbi:hypothetical protein RRF57_010849 [Xylaria bambusicola]|uniref:Uncharacterized protein n=1 Tax=Xylaria bambusicola TaxID=326684 RepID=A0AAN7ZCT0_9PEZI
MERRVAANENTPATMVTAVANFSPVPPGAISTSRSGVGPYLQMQRRRGVFTGNSQGVGEATSSTIVV